MTFPWSSPIVLAPLFAGAVTVALFCLWEWKGARLPIVPSTSSYNSQPWAITLTLYRNVVYIFKQVTVTGVYITMLIKYVPAFRIRRPPNDSVSTAALSFTPRYSTCPSTSKLDLGTPPFAPASSSFRCWSARHSRVSSRYVSPRFTPDVNMLIPLIGPNYYVDGALPGTYDAWNSVLTSQLMEPNWQATIYVGFGIWTIACGCLSTVTPVTTKGLLVFFMLLAGTGAGGVSIYNT